MSWNLYKLVAVHCFGCRCATISSYLESVSIVAVGSISADSLLSARFKFHSSSRVSFEKSASTAPALVPVARKGAEAPGDQVKAAVRGISLSLTMVGKMAASLYGMLQCGIQVPNPRLPGGFRWLVKHCFESAIGVREEALVMST